MQSLAQCCNGVPILVSQRSLRFSVDSRNPFDANGKVNSSFWGLCRFRKETCQQIGKSYFLNARTEPVRAVRGGGRSSRDSPQQDGPGSPGRALDSVELVVQETISKGPDQLRNGEDLRWGSSCAGSENLFSTRSKKSKAELDSRGFFSGHPASFVLSSFLPIAIPQLLLDSFSLRPATLQSSLIVTASIFALGFPLLLSGLSLTGMAASFVLGSSVWWAFGAEGFLLVALYFILGTGVTKVRMEQKEAEGIAEKKKGRRGVGSVLGSGTAGILCAFGAVYANSFGDLGLAALFQLGFVASFCTKLSDTTGSEIGKAFGKTAYLVTTLKMVPRGTEGAVSVEGTLAGLLAATALAAVAFFFGQVSGIEAIVCVIASQIANYGESFLGATLQDKEGWTWLNNDVVNVLNISAGAILAMLFKLLLNLF